MSELKVYTAGKVFTGTDMLAHYAVVVRNGRVESLVPDLEVENINGDIIPYGEDALIAPAFMDIQLYGAFGRLLSVYPDAETVKAIYDYSRQGGAAWCQPTVATNSQEVFFKCIDAVRDYWKQGGKGVIGLQVEGPWISKEKKGAHIEKFIHSPQLGEVKALLDYGKDVIKFITLAPETVDPEIINYIKSRKVIVSVGHSNASYAEATQYIDSCHLHTATHLFNAMSPMQHRSPGLVGAILDHASIRSSIIPDGYHVAFPVVRLAQKLMGERLFVITDAVTETAIGPYQHHLDGDKYVANGTLSGSALKMNKAVKNLVEQVGVPLSEALRMCSLYPAKLMGMADSAGLLHKGFPATMAVLHKDYSVAAVMD